MKISVVFTLAIAAALLPASAAGQIKRPRRPSSKPRPTPNIIAPLDVRTAKEKVSNQLANVTRFTDILGPIAANIEAVDRESASRRGQSGAIDNEARKQKVIAAISNLRAGLVALETEFRTKAALRKFLPKIDGITQLSAQAEDMASAGKFTNSRQPLLTVLQKLSDTLAAMP